MRKNLDFFHVGSLKPAIRAEFISHYVLFFNGYFAKKDTYSLKNLYQISMKPIMILKSCIIARKKSPTFMFLELTYRDCTWPFYPTNQMRLYFLFLKNGIALCFIQ